MSMVVQKAPTVLVCARSYVTLLTLRLPESVTHHDEPFSHVLNI